MCMSGNQNIDSGNFPCDLIRLIFAGQFPCCHARHKITFESAVIQTDDIIRLFQTANRFNRGFRAQECILEAEGTQLFIGMKMLEIVRCNTEDCDFLSADLTDGITRKDRFSLGLHIACNAGGIQIVEMPHEGIFSVIKIMIAEIDIVISEGIHGNRIG